MRPLSSRENDRCQDIEAIVSDLKYIFLNAILAETCTHIKNVDIIKAYFVTKINVCNIKKYKQILSEL